MATIGPASIRNEDLYVSAKFDSLLARVDTHSGVVGRSQRITYNAARKVLDDGTTVRPFILFIHPYPVTCIP